MPVRGLWGLRVMEFLLGVGVGLLLGIWATVVMYDDN